MLVIYVLSFQGPEGGVTFPMVGVSITWFVDIFEPGQMANIPVSFSRSVALATVVSLATVAMSVAAGLAFRRPFPGSGVLFYLAVASLVMPGLLVGFGIGLSTLARGVGITFISALFPIPKIALLPLLILWLGIGEEPKIATIALGGFFSTAISVYSGVDAVPRNLIRMAQSFNVPFHAIVRRVIWPGALPSILAGFRITASVALLLVVSAEMIGAEYGIGAFVLQAGNLMQTDQLLAGVVILSLFGLVVGKLINMLEARLLHWR